MRSDARRNRERVLASAVGLILETGREPARDAIAEAAGVGIGTLYRHFPDRQSLLHAVARHVLEGAISAGESIVDSDVGGEEAVRCYLHSAIDHGIGVVNMIHPLLDDPDWPDLQVRAEKLMRTLLERVRRDGQLRSDLAAEDIVFASVRFGRPLAIGLPEARDREVAHRQLDSYVDGLRAPRSTAEGGSGGG
ncbi:MAG: TetR/AcrR family transcriptional regulator [Acidimicrobiales bacterium]|nr:TetR/AcrR family transcriptional regulator [Acidimicrobiales bacterium]